MGSPKALCENTPSTRPSLEPRRAHSARFFEERLRWRAPGAPWENQAWRLRARLCRARLSCRREAARAPWSSPHFPDRVHALVWRNWPLVPVERIAQVLGTAPEAVARLGAEMGLGLPPSITPGQQRRSYITVIRRNWHLLPYEQLLQLLGWTAEQMAFTLREDDFLYVKLGNLKPRCEPIRYDSIPAGSAARRQQLAKVLEQEFGSALRAQTDPLFGFVERLSQPPSSSAVNPAILKFSPRFCYSYFALYGDPLLDPGATAYPDGYLAQLAAVGVDGVWLQGVLHKLAPFPWDAAVSARWEERLARLRELGRAAPAATASPFTWYLNEPRSMPLSSSNSRPELKGRPRARSRRSAPATRMCRSGWWHPSRPFAKQFRIWAAFLPSAHQRI